jgi:radical S-adenosyl methionine domain-containing protein 2
MSFKSVCWDITSKCNEHCLFCYRDCNVKESSLEKNKIILKKLISYGVGKISFVGGEPLLYNDLFELIEYGKSLSDKVQYSLTTNAVLLAPKVRNGNFCADEKLIKRISYLFDWITFSLDASEESLQTELGRNPNHVSRILFLLDYFKKSKIDLKTKINTVVTKKNIDQIEKLTPLLEYNNISRWKLFKFLPSRGYALSNKDKYSITDLDFANLKETLLKSTKLKITFNNNNDFQKTYITINAEGFLVVFDGINYNHVLDMSTCDYSKIFDFVDLKLHNERRSNYLIDEVE